MSETRTIRLLTAIVAVGLGVRFVHFWFIAETAFPRFPLVFTQSDMYAFWQWAQTIVAGDWLGLDTYHPYFDWMKEVGPLEHWYVWWGGKEVYHQAPLYPYFLALVFSFQNAPAFAFLVQLLVGATQPLILFFLARRLFDTRVALVSAALTAFYGPFVFYQATLLRDWIPPILEPLILLLVLRAEEHRRTADWLVAGMVIGVGLLTKETTLAVSGIAIVWLIIRHRCSWRGLRRPLALLGAGLLVCLAPLFARNVSVGVSPFAVSGQGPGNVLVGLVTDTSPVGFSPPSHQTIEIARKTAGTAWLVVLETLRAHKSNLGDILSHQLIKVRGIVDPFEFWNNTSYYYGVEISPALAVSLGYGVIFPLGVAGMLVLLPAWRRMSLFYSYLFASMAVQMITIVLARFRLALVPVLILGAAFFLVELLSTLRRRQFSRAVALVTLVLALSLFQQLLAPVTPGRSHIRAQEYILAAQAYEQEKRYELALLELARLRENLGQATPQVFEGHLRIKWAADLLLHGNREAARRQVQLAQKVYTEAGDDTGTALYNSGIIYIMLGEPDKATEFFEEYLNRHPHGPKAHEIRDLLASLEKS